MRAAGWPLALRYKRWIWYCRPKYQCLFNATRPQGIAERNTAMGFCFFNNVAVAAQHALTFHALDRVAIIDFDVHQGNGTIDIFENDPRVLVCSSFQHPSLPEQSLCHVKGSYYQYPLSAYTKGKDFRNKTEKDWLNRLQNHKPQLILISAGFDAHKDDPMADVELVADDYRWVTEMLKDVGQVLSDDRIVSVLEGGYNLKALAESAKPI